MRDERRHGPTASSSQAITGGFTPALASPGAQRPPAALTGMDGRAARPGGTGTEQGKRQLQAAGEGETQAGSVWGEGVS